MARSITIRAIERRADRVYIRFGKDEIEVPANTLVEFRDWVKSQFDEKNLLALILAAYIARDPNLTNPGLIVGRTTTLDLTGQLNYPDSVLRVS